MNDQRPYYGKPENQKNPGALNMHGLLYGGSVNREIPPDPELDGLGVDIEPPDAADSDTIRLESLVGDTGGDYFVYEVMTQDEYKTIAVFGVGRPPALPMSLSPLYKQQQEITAKKKKDLMKLCTQGAIPEQCHHWYMQLPVMKLSKNKA
ncbi:hypothetical protein GE061_011682 [Apolygus lucorum]|uniref:Uncharacterized protein n=1 Tax=Apolygus lucorum TaxID=248454 RepID=A0A8S9XZD4_APOLU|nr:hypothetical protein GE061_011682 [Apolygus lucorum]